MAKFSENQKNLRTSILRRPERGGWTCPWRSKRTCSTTERNRRACELSASPNPGSGSPPMRTGSFLRTGEIIIEGIARAALEVPLLPAVHGHLRALRRLRRQVPLLHRHRRPQEHAGPRAELFRSVYRKEFTTAGKILGKIFGARPSSPRRAQGVVVLFYQCRRSAVVARDLLLPTGSTGDEITIIGRELLELPGAEHRMDCRSGGKVLHEGEPSRPRTSHDRGDLEYFVDDIETITGKRFKPTFNRKGRRDPFCNAVGRPFRRSGHLYRDGVSDAVRRARARLHLEHLRL